MAKSSSISNHHVRSISLPSISHPSIVAMEEQLHNKLKTRDAPLTTDRICSDLSQLEELYRSVDEFILASSLTQQALSHHQNEGCMSELLDASVRLLDICGRTRDMMSQIQENVRDVQSALRRRKGEYSRSIAKYTSFSNKIKKDAKKLIAELKQVDNKVAPLVDLDHQVSSVIRVLRAVSSLTVSIFQSFLTFLAATLLVPRPTSKWSLVSKLMQKGTSATPNENELESRLEMLDVCMNDVDSDMERVFRRLIATRASLLNVVSY